MRIHPFHLVSVLFLMAFSQCDNPGDTSDPSVVFIEPQRFETFDLPDTIQVRASVVDDQIITTVVVNLLNEDGIPAAPGRYFYPASAEFQAVAVFDMTDPSLESGTYSIQVAVSDGENNNIEYLPVIINEQKKEILGYISVTQPLSFKSQITAFNKFFSTDTQFTMQAAWKLTEIKSLWHQYFFVTQEPSEIFSFDASAFDINWVVNALPPRPVITALFADDDLLFATANGEVGMLNSEGMVTLRTPAFDDRQVTCLAAGNDLIFAAFRSIDGQSHWFTALYKSTGAVYDQKTLATGIMEIKSRGNQCLAFYAADGNMGIMEYNPDIMDLSVIKILPGESLKGVEKVSDNRFLLVTERCVINYNYLSSSLVDFTNQPFEFARYEPLNNIVFLGKGNTVTGYDLQTGDLMKELDFQDEVADFRVLYNK